uniref:Uncharacterized protein n=1 Tax=Panagrolaimus sp. JU765 TaxID=591449 RepID=A0AC34QC01_9BILA
MANTKEKKKKKKSKKKAFGGDDFALDSEKVVKKLSEKYGSKKNETEVVKHAKIVDGKLVHPTKYLTLIERAKNAQWNRICLPADAPEKLIPGRWICALCQNYSCHGVLDDLFGPYYSELDFKASFFPDFLFQEGTEIPMKPSEPHSVDVYFHGRCAYWSENLCFIGGEIPRLKENLYRFWNFKCIFCPKIGASIRCPDSNDKYAHFQCLHDHGFKFNSSILSITSPVEDSFISK